LENRADKLSQSSVIVGFTIAAFIVFITVRGKLPVYMGFLTGGTAEPPKTASNTASTVQSTLQTVGQVAQIAAMAG